MLTGKLSGNILNMALWPKKGFVIMLKNIVFAGFMSFSCLVLLAGCNSKLEKCTDTKDETVCKDSKNFVAGVTCEWLNGACSAKYY